MHTQNQEAGDQAAAQVLVPEDQAAAPQALLQLHTSRFAILVVCDSAYCIRLSHCSI